MIFELNGIAQLVIDAKPTFEFTVPSRLVPAPRMTHKSKWTRGKRYMEYRKKLQIYAVKAGIQLPLKGAWFIFVEAFLENNVLFDIDNGIKSIFDGLFKQDRLVNGYLKRTVHKNIEPFTQIFLWKL